MKPLHPEQIKAAIRIKYGTLLAFEEAHGLGRETARDVLRGRASRRTANAMAEALGVSVESILKLKQSKLVDHTSRKRDSHRLNEVAS